MSSVFFALNLNKWDLKNSDTLCSFFLKAVQKTLACRRRIAQFYTNWTIFIKIVYLQIKKEVIVHYFVEYPEVVNANLIQG